MSSNSPNKQNNLVIKLFTVHAFPNAADVRVLPGGWVLISFFSALLIKNSQVWELAYQNDKIRILLNVNM